MAEDRPCVAPGPDAAEPVERRREQGVILVVTALMLGLLIGVAGCAVDLGTWYLNVRRLQSSADAAALGGVIFLPEDLPGATQVATDITAGHGLAPAEVQVAVGSRPNQLRVTVTRTVDNVFLGLLGLETTRVERTSLAEYQAPLPMGSPTSYLGNDPEATDGRRQPDHWMMVTSLRNSPNNGDRYHAGGCGANAHPCRGTTPRNPEYDSDGYIYAVNVQPVLGQDLLIQVFDAALYEVNETCTKASTTVWGSSNVSGNAAALRTAVAGNPDVPVGFHDDAHLRYVRGLNSWCTGDGAGGAATGGGGPVNTTYIVRGPDDTGWIDSDNPLIPSASCRPVQYRGYDNAWFSSRTIWQRLTPDSDPNGEWRVTFPPGAWRQTFANTWRRWSTVCRIPSALVQPGTYLLQVRTNAALGTPMVADNTVDTWGHNRHAIRAGFVPAGLDATPSTTGAQIHAKGRMPVFVNASGAATQFYMSRLPPSSAGRVLNLTLWDISDGSSNGSMRVVPPAEATVGGVAMTNFSGCTFTKSGGTWLTDADTCTISYDAGALNAKLVTIGVPVPESYSCAANDPFGCWVKIETNYSGAVDDTTTWSADLVGNPVRLVE